MNEVKEQDTKTSSQSSEMAQGKEDLQLLGQPDKFFCVFLCAVELMRLGIILYNRYNRC